MFFFSLKFLTSVLPCSLPAKILDDKLDDQMLYREKMQQQTALVKKNIRPAMPDQLQIHLRHRMTQLKNELARWLCNLHPVAILCFTLECLSFSKQFADHFTFLSLDCKLMSVCLQTSSPKTCGLFVG
jgi:hypothetical protein